MEHNHRRELVLYALALYLATSFAQLHAKQIAWPTGDGLSLAKIETWVHWHLIEMGRAAESEGYLFTP